jgi:hypothetical protein
MGSAFTVLNALEGFLEKVHENALSLEIRAAGLHVRVLHASPFCICAMILSWPAAPQGR